MTYYVETYRPSYNENRERGYRSVAARVHSAKEYSVDVLSPSMTAVFEVDACRTKAEALALVAEYAAGFRVAVRLIMGGYRGATSA